MVLIPAIRIAAISEEQVVRAAETPKENLFITVLTEIIQHTTSAEHSFSASSTFPIKPRWIHIDLDTWTDSTNHG